MNGRSNGREEAARAGRAESWLALLRRRRLAGLSVFVPLFVLASLLVLTARPIWRSEARVRLGEPPPMGGVSPTAGFFGLMRLGGDPFANDLELLSSRTLAEGVMRDVSLNAQLFAPKGWYRDSVFTRFEADSTTADALYEFTWTGDGGVAVRMKSPRDSAIVTGTTGGVLSFGGVRVVVQQRRPSMPERFQVRTHPFAFAVSQTAARIAAERSRRDANVVAIVFDDADPALANQAVQSIIDRFVSLRTTIQGRESRQTVDSLRVVAGETMAELQAAENALESWQRETRLVAPEVQSEVFVTRYGTLLSSVEQAQLELDAITAIVDRLESAPDTAAAWSTLLTHPGFLASETIGQMLSRLMTLEQSRVELATRRAEGSREYQLLVDQIAQLDATLRSLASNYRTQLANRIASMQEQANTMDIALAAVPSQTIEMGRRQRAIRLLSEIILLTEQRLRQEELRQALTFSNVQLIDPPALRWKAVWPRRKVGLGIGFLIATSFALLAMVVAERADRKLRRATDIERTIGAPVLAVTIAPRSGLPFLSDPEVRAVARHAGPNGPPARVAVAPVEHDSRSQRIAHALANGEERRPPSTVHQLPVLDVIPAIDDFAAAAAADGGSVALVVHYGKTRRDAVARACRLLEAAGATVAGAIVVCERERDTTAVWS
jgi:uncharacterized protein involved in exopolysaccharide biosynthesis